MDIDARDPEDCRRPVQMESSPAYFPSFLPSSPPSLPLPSNAPLLAMSFTTSIHLDPGEQWNYLSPQAIPPNVPTTGEDSVVIAPWLEEPVSPFFYPPFFSLSYFASLSDMYLLRSPLLRSKSNRLSTQSAQS